MTVQQIGGNARFDEHEPVAHVVVPLGAGLMREAWVYVLKGFKGYPHAMAPGDGTTSAPGVAP